ncbi:MAG TPA: hypothetical protein VKZ51_00460 [Cyclobacteriaceae bacterium]|nr:hypothetical protein [Cyclobacteriaceae bacterium]
MKKIPKHNIYTAPEGYFESLTDRVFRRKKTQQQQRLIVRIAAAAVFIIGMVLFSVRQPGVNEGNFQSLYDQEVELYINSGIWDAEDVLLLAENPDELLDDIIIEEWSAYGIDEHPTEEEFPY